ncbi:MAG: hypothetical protein CL431_02915 [Acidimicrobiaceae bacterium]|nr:hypothetical protein [Acidimicrobiaceae bacterium]
MSQGIHKYEEAVNNTISKLHGNCLLLLPVENLPIELPQAVSKITERLDDKDDSTYDSILSIGNLASESNLSQFLHELKYSVNTDSQLYFCERTQVPDRYSGSARYDITGSVWEAGWSVIHCERFRIGKAKRSPSYVFGVARIKRFREQNL